MNQDAHAANSVASVGCAILTISDTRTSSNDASGALIRDGLLAAGHQVVVHEILPDEPDRLRARIRSLVSSGTCAAILLTGGTGIAPRDTTYEAVSGLLQKRLDGFGELFRMLSYQEVGAAAMLSRAIAGIVDHTVVFAMPGSVAAVHLAMEKLILPRLGHVAALLRK